VLTFKTCDHGYEVKTDCIKDKLKKQWSKIFNKKNADGWNWIFF
jgi:hypothetical protein